MIELSLGHLYSLCGAALLDFWLGDPWHWLHPVQVIGAVIEAGTQLIFGLGQRIPMSVTTQRLYLRISGGLLAWGVILGTGGVSWLLVAGGERLLPGLGWGVAIILLASCLAGRSLRVAAVDVLTPWQQGDLVTARSRLSRYVGRDTENLDAGEILRAVLETVTENATDGVFAPLFYAGVGCLIPGLGPIPLAMAYKAASTLDSMIGYRRFPYADLGWVAAKTEDILTWFPCRLVVLSLLLWAKNPRQAWEICCRDAPLDPSPNAGWSECAYAVVLGVQMGGENYYQGERKVKPRLGKPEQPITVDKIYQALSLTRWLSLAWLSLLTLGIVAWQLYPDLDNIHGLRQ
ncbi:adenosylcobinamide-phosphate synthase CbiB [Synechococcus sp. PCC 6312]|uniref:adenosylcobinamide-phosphate synthase CbiB n=1 Tax=Synechococcus sp. (strain ATCC 27167 / PCC 6312) TaxID=195253 RepID=UPI00029F0A34|nr:adenosylcobinamide-phosphate synthase CbiB [Synechococcus sp. PCC 6312]AFY61123.1 adenosylcobinamide-phosphate synthase [Synechococcus sp. PCC 6312]